MAGLPCTDASARGRSELTTMAVIAMLTGVNTWFRSGGRLSLSDVEDIYWDMVKGVAT